ILENGPNTSEFQAVQVRLSVSSIIRFIRRHHIDVIIDYMELRHRYLFPTYFLAKGLLRRKMVYWGQGRDLLDAKAPLKNLAYAAEQRMCDAIILYAEHLKKYVPKSFHKKVFIANNTLFLGYTGLAPGVTRENVLADYGIHTKKNIICVGRMQRRKRVEHLAEALAFMNRHDIGLILVGPDAEGVLDRIHGKNIYRLGPIYQDKKFDLLSSADVYCLPGAVGLSIVDAFHCGLPFVTEEGDESAEIMYLKDGVNGFIVPRGDIPALSDKLQLLLDDDELRRRFSAAAKREITENGSLDKFCSGFRDALFHATGGTTGSLPNPDRQTFK
ncbi:glycosyltransferase family 4 protein, partial [Candidatus Bathyarchaeota archaeon]|nr:glycosyltransferase family 4 protein [Candidatus Bathyarchaeota archaeon]